MTSPMANGSIFGCPICYMGGWPSTGPVNWSKGGTSSRRLCAIHLQEKRAAARSEYAARKKS